MPDNVGAGDTVMNFIYKGPDFMELKLQWINYIPELHLSQHGLAICL